VQNKLYRQLVKKNAAELVHARPDSKKPFAGMKSCDRKIEKQIIKQDVIIAKNYLDENEMKPLGKTARFRG